jgi:glycine betaine/proline transport system permease protein
MRMDWLIKFPHMNDDSLRTLKKAIDEGFRAFTRAYGDPIEAFFSPLQVFLIHSERFMTATPWPIILLLIGAIAWFASRNWRIVAGCIVTLLVIGYFDMWDDTMKTISMIFVCALLSIIIGIPIGILMARSNRLQNVINPILDVMQTMPSFVYLIPVVMLLGIGKVPGLIAVVIYAIPPMIRLTNLGIRLVDKDVLEAADAFGSSPWQRLKDIQIPLAMPTIMAGINQTIMMSLAMVVIASMIGVQGLGQPVLRAIANQYFTLGVFNGLAIVGIAIIFDRVSQAYGRRLQKHSEVVHG